MSERKNQFYCPVCHNLLKNKLRNHVGWAVHLKLMFTTLMTCGAAYALKGPELASRWVFIYLPMWAVADFFHGVKMRHASKCDVCDFDPVLYQRDWQAARKTVEQKMNIKKTEITDNINARTAVLVKTNSKSTSLEVPPQN